MALKGILPKKGKKEYYWAFVLESDWVQAAIWNIFEGKVNVSSVGPPSAWKSEEELVGASDSALSASIQNFAENEKEPEKTVFGIPNLWAENGEIKEEHLAKIKRICTELSLSPIGFVVITEAIVHIIKSEEGGLANAIIVGIGTDCVEVSVVKNGKVFGSTNVSRSVSLDEDLVEGLVRILGENGTSPSRIILYNGRDVELGEMKEILDKVSWEEKGKTKFLHPPKIEIITSERKVVATALAGGSELVGAKSAEVEKNASDADSTSLNNKGFQEPESDSKNTGFVVNEDIQNVSEANFGESDSVTDDFIKNAAEEVPLEQGSRKIDHKQMVDEVSPGDSQGENSFTGRMSKITGVFLKLIPKRKSGVIKSSPPSGGKKIFVIGGITLLTLTVAGFFAWWFLPKAEVTVYVSPKRIEDRLEIKVNTSTSAFDVEKGILLGEIVKSEVSGDKTKPTTGKKTVGDKATGRVMVYRSGGEITLSSDTVIVSSDGLEFTLNGGITVASGSASSPGKKEIDVTASGIGSEYNLVSGQNFTVGNYPSSEIEAKSESDFSGGTSREICAVSQEDQTELEEELKSELLDDARDKISRSISSEKILVVDTIKENVVNRNFSEMVGDESENLKLSLDLSIEGVVVDKGDLVKFAIKSLESKVPHGFSLRDEQVSVDFEFNEEEEGVYVLDAIFRANLLPEVDPESIAEKIAGKYPAVAEEYLVSLDGFERAEISQKLKLPGKLGSLPRVKGNIDVSIAASQ